MINIKCNSKLAESLLENELMKNRNIEVNIIKDILIEGKGEKVFAYMYFSQDQGTIDPGDLREGLQLFSNFEDLKKTVLNDASDLYSDQPGWGKVVAATDPRTFMRLLKREVEFDHVTVFEVKIK